MPVVVLIHRIYQYLYTVSQSRISEMSSEREEKAFMTPAQQRAYLNELRKQNEEMYKLTGPRSHGTSDPWQSPVPNPKTVPIATGKGSRLHGPPKPPKTTKLQTSPNVGTPRSPPLPSVARFEADSSNDLSNRTRPKTLPKPQIEQISQSGSHDLAAPTPEAKLRKFPTIAQKPVRSELKSHEPEPPKKVSLSLTNYDLSSYPDVEEDQHANNHEHRMHRDRSPCPKDDGKLVSIPVFSFSDLTSSETQT